jgi:hypothetical protein
LISQQGIPMSEGLLLAESISTEAFVVEVKGLFVEPFVLFLDFFFFGLFFSVLVKGFTKKPLFLSQNSKVCNISSSVFSKVSRVALTSACSFVSFPVESQLKQR